MVLDVACAHAALRQCGRIGRQWGTVPRRETHGRVPHCTLAGAGEYFARVNEAVSLGTQSEYAALDKEKLNQGSDAKYDVNEDRGGGIAKRIVRNVLRGAVGAIGTGAAATMGQTSDGKDPAHNGAANQKALERECKQCGQTKTAV